MFLTDYIHRILDYALSTAKLIQNREVGWMTLDRKSGQYKREQQPIFKKLKLLFLFSRPLEWVDRTHLLRLWIHDKSIKAGKEEATEASAQQIASFVDMYHINMAEFTPSDIHAYRTFEEFFVRKHTPSSRPIHSASDPTSAVCVADSRLVVYPTVSQTRALWIKGKNFTISNLIQDRDRALAWDDGAVASFRLSPQDYHRYHSPVTGTVSWFQQIPGDYYQVDPVCLQSDVDILTQNARSCVVIDTEDFGKVLFVAIGATNVGTVEIHEHVRKGNVRIKKGEEIGLFQFGGSSIIVAFEPGRIEFDEDLLSVSRRQVMMDVDVGMSLGKARRSG